MDTSIGIHGLDIIMSSSNNRENASKKLLAIRYQLENFENVKKISEYAKSGNFAEKSLHIESMRIISRAIRYFSECNPSTEVQLYINKYVECLRILLPNLIHLINESTANIDELVEMTAIFSESTFGFHEYLQIFESYDF